MADNDEATALKKEIEYLTNLINGSTSRASSGAIHNSRVYHHPAAKRNVPGSFTTHAQQSTFKSKPAARTKYKLTRNQSPISQTHISQTHISQTHISQTHHPSPSNVWHQKKGAVGTDKIHSVLPQGSLKINRTKNPTSQLARTVLTHGASQKDTVRVNRSVINSVSRTGLTAPSAGIESASKSDSPEASSGAAVRRVVKLPSSGPQAKQVSTSRPSSSGRVVCLPASESKTVGLQPQKPASVKPKPLVRSSIDSCLQSKHRVVVPSKADLERCKTSLSLTTSQKSGSSDVSRQGGIMTSPTVIKAGKKIIEEIEKLNKAMVQLEKCARSNASKVTPETCNKGHSSETKVTGSPVKSRVVLPHSASTPALPTRDGNTPVQEATIFKNDKFRFVKAPTPKSSSSASINEPGQTAMKVVAEKSHTDLSRGNAVNKVNNCQREGNYSAPSLIHKGSQSPYKLVRSTSSAFTPPQKPVRNLDVVQGSTSNFSHSYTSPIVRNRYKLRQRNPVAQNTKNPRRVLHPALTSRRRVYLTRSRLQNSHSPSVSHTAVPGTAALTSSPTASVSKLNQSADVKVLLQELTFIDAALKTAKLQSSQKLLKRALVTKQKMMQRRSAEKKMPALPARNQRYRQTKWTTPVRRARSRSHSMSRSPVKGQKSWKSRFSLRKSGSGTDLNINQLLGRTVDNLSSNKYKFIKRKTPGRDGAGKYTARTTRYSPVNKNSLKVDRRTPTSRDTSGSQRARRSRLGRQLVSIGGIIYKTSQRKLTRTTPKKVVSRKGLCKLSPRIVAVGGRKYRVTRHGLNLLRVNNDKDGVKRVSLGGVKYIQTRPGTLVRAANTASRTTASRFIYRSIATKAAAVRQKKVNGRGKTYCMFYNRFGKCNRGDKCPYVHDPDKVAVCTRFLRGTCKVTDCPFSHQVAPEKMPVCTHFLRGVCSRDHCPYRHVKVSRDAELCRDFVNGYCPLADKCKKKHSRECPKHDGKGQCPDGAKCKLFHPRRGEKRPTECDDHPATRKPRTKLSLVTGCDKVRMCVEEDVERHLPLRERHLPSFISISSGDLAKDDSIMSSPNISFSGEEPLQIRPNLSFDTS